MKPAAAATKKATVRRFELLRVSMFVICFIGFIPGMKIDSRFPFGLRAMIAICD